MCQHDNTMRVLVVEDDAKLVRALRKGLSLEGYEVDVAVDGEAALDQAGAKAYDAVVLDVMLPGMDGFEVCESLRRTGHWVPVLMLTARAEVDNRIRGLDAGADDYLVKPFDFGELLARLRVLTRRGPARAGRLVAVADLHLDSSTRTVTRSGKQVELTAREFDVLEVLARRPNELVSRADLVQEVWHKQHEEAPNLADVYVGLLRKKLERPRGRRLIRTVRGKGFVLEAP